MEKVKPTGIVKLHCKELHFDVEGITIKISDIGQIADACKLILETDKGVIEFVSLKKINEVLKCPICNKQVSFVNNRTIELDCPCSNNKRLFQVI